MIRRSLKPGDREITWYLSNAPETVSISEMAWAGCQRWSIEVDFKLAKGEVGLDQYELTKYRGWYHHITLSILALAFLKGVQLQWGKNLCRLQSLRSEGSWRLFFQETHGVLRR